MTRAEYNEILRLHNQGLSVKKACDLLNISYILFRNTQYRGGKCDDEGKIKWFRWDNSLNNELLQLMSDNHLNFSEAFRIFAEKYNIPKSTVSLHWYSILKKKTTKSICESTGRGLIVRNVKIASERCPVKEENVKETTNEMRKLHNIPIFDSTINFSFKYIYYK